MICSLRSRDIFTLQNRYVLLTFKLDMIQILVHKVNISSALAHIECDNIYRKSYKDLYRCKNKDFALISSFGPMFYGRMVRIRLRKSGLLLIHFFQWILKVFLLLRRILRFLLFFLQCILNIR